MNDRIMGNLIGDQLDSSGEQYEVCSPVTGNAIATVPAVDEQAISRAIQYLAGTTPIPSEQEVFGFIERLRQQCLARRDLLLEMNLLETGFIHQDNTEAVDAVIEFLADFKLAAEANRLPEPPVVKHAYSGNADRHMRLIRRPYRCVAALVPQNASLSLAVITIASALFVGSKVIIRPSLQCGATGALLAQLILDSDPPPAMIALTNCKAKDFLSACYQSDAVDLIHYIGSDQYAGPVLRESFSNGKVALIDGEGNGMLYVDESFPIEQAVDLIIAGATRCNGETCTSINGVLANKTIYGQLKQALRKACSNLVVGDPRELASNIGPLFSARQASAIKESIADSPTAQIFCGGEVEGAYLQPTIVTDVQANDRMVREGFFGPAFWLKGIDESELWPWLEQNRFPLSDTILSLNQELTLKFIRRSRAARICINEDPSIESMFEPWGGYPPGGLNPVSVWTEKYQQTIQIDGRPSAIMSFSRDTQA